MIGTLAGDPTKVMVFGYDTGAAMVSITAPARRAGLFLSETTAVSLNSIGWSIFDAVVNWAAEPAPLIFNISPSSGPIGTSVTISGTNFGMAQGSSVVTFNGVTATPTNWTDNIVVVPVPAGATTGAVVVTVNGLASNGQIFTVGVADSDGDGLLDSWELQYFGNLNQTAGGDPDGDGLTNLTEFQQGRNPTKGSVFDNRSFVNLKIFTPPL
jgi:hypothetical protein